MYLDVINEEIYLVMKVKCIFVFIWQSSVLGKWSAAKYVFYLHNKFPFLGVTVRKIQHLILIQNIKETL